MRRFIYVVCLHAVVFASSPAAMSSELRVGYDAALRGDFEMALRVWRPLAEDGVIEAQVYLGIAYSNGLAGGQLSFDSAVPQDFVEATKWFRRAAEQGVFDAKMYLKEVSVFQDSHDLANQGNAVAQLNLGALYTNGYAICSWCSFRVISQDFAEAASWFQRAAEQDYATAQFNLAVIYQQGQGVPQDLSKAVKLYRQAAAQGDARAQMNLGLMYANGHGVPQDYGEAKKWFLLTARQGNTNAWLLFGALRFLGVTLSHPYIGTSTWSEIAHVIEAE